MPQSPMPHGNPASGVTDSVQHTVQHVTDHAQVPGSPDASTATPQTANPLGHVGSTVHDTLGTMTDQLHSAASGVTPQAHQTDPTQALHSATDATSHGVDQAASHSPLGGDGVSPSANHVTDALEHNAVTDAVHDVGANGLDGLHL